MIAAVLLAAAVGAADCGQAKRYAIGGDYTDANDRRSLALVEAFHFTPEVEALKRGAVRVGEAIATTLEHYPNHHRALAAMARLGQRDRVARVHGARYSVDCYFERAARFRPNDPKVRALYAAHLQKTGRADAALAQMREALRLDPDDAAAHYNLGVLLALRRDYAQAREHARQAYRLGLTLPGLKNKLAEAGQWGDD